jgi:beta-galactosidase/beta-glucuronidase
MTVLLMFLVACTAESNWRTGVTGRMTTSLDGEWSFVLVQPSASNQSGKIMVPGSWEAQGYGNETVQMRKQVLTGDNAKGSEGAVGIYTKTVMLPPCAVAGAKAVFTVDQGIHRHAIFKFGHNIVGEHRGYLTPFEAEIETGEVEIEITLDGGRPCNKGGCADALMGAQDDDTDGTGLGGWAGLNGHVAVECRPPVFIDGGVGSIVPPHIQHPPVTASSAGKPLTLSADFVISGGAAMAAVQIVDNSSGTPVVVAHNQSMAPLRGCVSLQVTLPAVKLWSPEQRALYTAVVSIWIGSPGSKLPAGAVDSASTRFGVRTIIADGYKLMLNGQRVFLAGYG